MEEVLTDANAWVLKFFYVGSGNNGKTRMNDEKGISVPTDDPHFSVQPPYWVTSVAKVLVQV